MLRSLMLKMGGAWLGGELRAMAEGKRGDRAKAIYWALAGWKTFTGFVLGATAAVFAAQGDTQGATIAGTLGGILVAGGLIDGRWRSAPKWETSPAWKLLRDHAPDVLAGLGAGTAYFTACTPDTAALFAHVHLTCRLGVFLCFILTAVFTWLMGEAQLSDPPAAH